MSAFNYKKDGIVFLHLTKSGGTSVRKTLQGDYHRKLIYPGAEEWDWTRSFTVLRNPIDRFMSGWNERALDYRARKIIQILKNDKINACLPQAPRNRQSTDADIKHHMVSLAHPINYHFLKRVSQEGYIIDFNQIEKGFNAVMKKLDVSYSLPEKTYRKQQYELSFNDLIQQEQDLISEYLSSDIELYEKLIKKAII